jgi:hypothetical protein
VFPALDIIRRAGPPELLRDQLEVSIAAYLASAVWHVREIAARTLCSCLLHERWFDSLQGLLQGALQRGDAALKNHVHGVLLAFKFVIERLAEVAPELLLRKYLTATQTNDYL